MSIIDYPANMRCPHCGNEEHFYISARVLSYVTNEGSEAADNGSIDWDSDSTISCPECDRSGTVVRFTATNENR